MRKILISASIAIALLAAHTAQADDLIGKTFHSRDSEVLTCDDMTAVPEAMDYIKHDPNNANLLTIMQQGNCSPLDPSVNFKVTKQYVWQIPAGPQRLAQIEIQFAQNPNMQPAKQWILESDIVQ
ncbi:hypothetical protein [Pseudomonas sp. MWU12-2345]|uniref:hypothetical protein n=1 Tax=Pseudomonas sp. MWU12-2345 TaxID=2928689 RepID=UPI00200EE3F2|nr:hypothetical protein [Pseudomonas sp. MWU12-2345]